MTLDDRGYPTGPIGFTLADREVLRQSDGRWAKRLLGRSSSTTIGSSGCTVTAVAQALRVLGVRAGATPLDVQAHGVNRPGVWAEGAAGAVVSELARAQRLTVGEDTGAGHVAPVQPLRALILSCLDSGGVALVCVDHDHNAPGGDDIGDHWVLAIGADADSLWVADPATGEVETLQLRTLTGPVLWGKRAKVYSVVRAVTLFR